MKITRREAVGIVAAAATSAALAGSVPATRHLFQVHDGGESYFYAATDPADAYRQHMRINYHEAGVDPSESDAQLSDCHQIADDFAFTIGEAGPKGEDVTRLAREWAADGEGMLATTCI